MSEGVCPHPVLFEQICVECGSRVDSTGYKQLADGTWVLPKQAEQLNGRLEGQLRHRKQLALVVDLDKTLIDTATVRDDDEAQRIISEDEEHRSDFLNLFAREHYLIRLRPHVREFLAKIEPLFYMQLYTLSERSYASEIIKFIDPQGTFFHGSHTPTNPSACLDLDFSLIARLVALTAKQIAEQCLRRQVLKVD